MYLTDDRKNLYWVELNCWADETKDYCLIDDMSYEFLEEEWLEVVQYGMDEIYIVDNVEECIEKLERWASEENVIKKEEGIKEFNEVSVERNEIKKGTELWELLN